MINQSTELYLQNLPKGGRMEQKPLKIALLSVHSSPLGKLGTKDTGGMSIYIRELAGELGKQGHIVDIYTRQQHQGGEQIIRLAENVRLIHLSAGPIGYLPKVNLYPFLPEFFRMIEKCRRHEKTRYDIVQSNYWLSGRVGVWAQIYWHIPHFVLFHTLAAVKNMFSVGIPEPALRFKVEKLVCKNSTRIVAETEREHKQLVTLYEVSPRKISIIPSGVNSDIFRPLDKQQCRLQLGLHDNQWTLLYVGRLDPLKGLENLIRALPLVTQQPVRLLIVGGEHRDKEYIQRLQTIAAHAGVLTQVSFMGRAEHEKLPLYYNAADALVLSSYTESFGLVALEALACGTPVVSTRVGAMDKIINCGINGFLVDRVDSHLLAREIEHLIKTLQAGNLSPQVIRTSVLHYCWPRVAAMIVNEYQSAIKRAQCKFHGDRGAYAALSA